ncbi:rod shape-determining protein MreC [Gammaproteobacteria bacterium]|nr:rod shape-determining protein MreC [Gammaproteobacteria bacterium]
MKWSRRRDVLANQRLLMVTCCALLIGLSSFGHLDTWQAAKQQHFKQLVTNLTDPFFRLSRWSKQPTNKHDYQQLDRQYHGLVLMFSYLQHLNQSLIEQNRQLKRLLGLSTDIHRSFYLSEQIGHTQRDGLLRLDRGESAGVKVGQAVIDEHGVVGTVMQVHSKQSLVKSYGLKDTILSIKVLPTGATLLAQGYGEIGVMKVVDYTNLPIHIGDQVNTSGLHKQYPAGLPVGVISGIENGPGQGKRVITLKLNSPTQQSRYYFILGVQ